MTEKENKPSIEVMDTTDPALVAVFARAMSDFDAARVDALKALGPHGQLKRSAYDRIQEAGNWNPGWFITEFALVCNRKSTQPHAVREFVSAVGMKAHALWLQGERAKADGRKPGKKAAGGSAKPPKGPKKRKG